MNHFALFLVIGCSFCCGLMFCQIIEGNRVASASFAMAAGLAGIIINTYSIMKEMK